MFVEYEDILSRIIDKPLWWQNGLPRFDPFQPSDANVYAYQVALVHTECQECGARYDVAVMPDRDWINLRDSIAYTNELHVGDPPNALHASIRCAGPTMGSIQIAILQFWEKIPAFREWQREPTFERTLGGAQWRKTGRFADSVLLKIAASERRSEWHDARMQGNFAGMVSILEDFECDRPREVAHAIDLQRRSRAFLDERVALENERLGSV